MSEIFVEEENTVYELDAECLKRKEEQKRRQRDSKEIRNKNSIYIPRCCFLVGRDGFVKPRRENRPQDAFLILLFESIFL